MEPNIELAHPHGLMPQLIHSAADPQNFSQSTYEKTSIASLTSPPQNKHSYGAPNPSLPVIQSSSSPNVLPNDVTVIDGVYYNSKGYEICGQWNQHSKPCQRIGRCPFHGGKKPKKISKDTPKPPIKKTPYKQGWTKDEHIRFLHGLGIHGKGSWKEISQIVGTRTPTQIQSHAQKYFLRQKQEVKNKRSIHDLTLEDLHEMGTSLSPINSPATNGVPGSSPRNVNGYSNSYHISGVPQYSSSANSANDNFLAFPGYSSIYTSPSGAPQNQSSTPLQHIVSSSSHLSPQLSGFPQQVTPGSHVSQQQMSHSTNFPSSITNSNIPLPPPSSFTSVSQYASWIPSSHSNPYANSSSASSSMQRDYMKFNVGNSLTPIGWNHDAFANPLQQGLPNIIPESRQFMDRHPVHEKKDDDELDVHGKRYNDLSMFERLRTAEEMAPEIYYE